MTCDERNEARSAVAESVAGLWREGLLMAAGEREEAAPGFATPLCCLIAAPPHHTQSLLAATAQHALSLFHSSPLDHHRCLSASLLSPRIAPLHLPSRSRSRSASLSNTSFLRRLSSLPLPPLHPPPTMSVLSQGCLRRAMLSDDVSGHPTLQVLELKAVKDRYRLILNDGEFYQQGMLTTQLNHLVTSGALKEGTIVRLNEFIIQKVGQRRVLIVLNLAVVQQGSPVAIGTPQNVEILQPGGGGGGAGGDPAMQQSAGIVPLKDINKPLPPSSSLSTSTSGVPAYLQKGASPFASSAGIGPTSSSFTSPASGGVQHFNPIASLSPYHNRWTIKARVTAKSDVRTWHNQKGEGKLFSVDLLDAAGGQIRATMFNDAVDKFESVFRVDGVYIVSKGQLKIANKKFSRVPHEYEVTLNSDAEVQYVADDASIEQQRFAFASIEEVGKREEGDFVDVIGVVQSVSPLSQITSKATQKQLTKRAVQLCDRSQLSVEVTLWGEQADKYNEAVLAHNPILAIKNVKVSNFGGKTLGTTFQSQIFLDPDRPEAHQLKQWWMQQGQQTAFNSLSTKLGGGGGRGISLTEERRPLSCIKEEQLGFKKNPQTGETLGDFLTVKATVTNIKHDFNKPPWYYACPSPSCNKKVTAGHGDDFWYATHTRTRSAASSAAAIDCTRAGAHLPLLPLAPL